MTKTQQDFLKAFTKGCSSERLRKYRQDRDSDGTVIARYLWNMRLSEALYPTLQALEVTLRNSLHDAVTTKYARADWYNIPNLLEPFGAREVVTAVAKLTDAARKKGLQPVALHTPGRVVAELTFGFWTGLFSAEYETNRRLWPALIVLVFPQAPRRSRSRREIARLLHPIRYLRNRVFHHEPIWNTPDLMVRHTQIVRLISWMNRDIHDAIMLFDRFPIVYASGYAQCLTELQRIMG